MGDRFAQQAEAQLRACLLAAEQGVEVIPVWNKSNREHLIVGSEPSSVREAAERAVKKLGWQRPWHVDADHIRLETVERFIPHSDFYTIDVADSIGAPASADAVEAFVTRHPELTGTLTIPGLDATSRLNRHELKCIAEKYLAAIDEVKKIYNRIAAAKGEGRFIVEVSMDETDSPQSPLNCWSSSRRWRTRKSHCKRSRRNSRAVSTKAWITSATSLSLKGSLTTTLP